MPTIYPMGPHTRAIQPYLLRPPSRAYVVVVHLARRMPWWSLSVAIHIAAIVLLWRFPYRFRGEETVLPTIQVKLGTWHRFVERLEPFAVLPDDPAAEEVVPEPDPPMPVVEVRAEVAEPAVEIPAPEVEVSLDLGLVGASEPPAPTPVFAVELPPTSPVRLFFAPRIGSSRPTATGGRDGAGRGAERAVRAGLAWLAHAQEPDGSWSCRRWGGGADHDLGVTGLALLAYLGAGYTQDKGPFRDTVRRALAWLRATQQPDGQFRWQTFYEQGIAAVAVTEAYALSASPQVGRMAQRAVDYVCRLQPEHGGFRYAGPVPRDDGDLSVTGWQIMALRSALCAGLEVPPEALERARTFLASTYRGNGASAYLVTHPGHSASTTAIGMLCRVFLGGGYEEEIGAAATYLLDHEQRSGGPGKGRNRLVGDLYYTYYATTAMFHVGGESWAKWDALFRAPLVAAQVEARRDARGRYVRGSWDPANHYWGSRAGRVYATAMALLSLEAYYRFLPVYKR